MNIKDSRRINIAFLGILALLISVFLFLRFYQIPSSLFFQNDMGRDFLVLYDWKNSGKPPLLGPQNSAFPFNQSAVYFYMLYPGFLLSGMSVYSSLYTNAFVYILCFILSLNFAKSFRLRVITVLSFGLIVFNPQVIAQNRFVWNPSFLPPLLLLSTITFLSLKDLWSDTIALVSIISLALAVALNFSAAPLVLGFLTVFFILYRQQIYKVVIATIAANLLANLPTLLFELKHSFLLTKAMLRGNYSPQVKTTFIDKLLDLSNYSFKSPDQTQNIILGIVFLLLIFGYFWRVNKGKFSFKGFIKKNQYFSAVFLLFFLSLLFTFMIPVQIQVHYVFGLLTLAFILLATLPLPLYLIAALVFSLVWLQPAIVSQYFASPPRTVAQLESCFQKVCSQEKEPLFVTVQAGFHPYHVGPEHRYLMKRSGCDVKYIETEPEAASEMALVTEQSSYDPQKTKYMELSEFGPSREVKTYTCEADVDVHILKR